MQARLWDVAQAKRHAKTEPAQAGRAAGPGLGAVPDSWPRTMQTWEAAANRADLAKGVLPSQEEEALWKPKGVRESDSFPMQRVEAEEIRKEPDLRKRVWPEKKAEA